MTNKKMLTITSYKNIHADIVNLLEKARHNATRSVNSIMSATYWEIGRHVVEFEQRGASRAEYGTLLITRLASDLTAKFGRGFSRQNIQKMRTFYLFWPRQKICQTLSGKFKKSRAALDLATLASCFPLPWSTYVRLLTVKDTSARNFYETEAMRGGWSVRQLDPKVLASEYKTVLPDTRLIAKKLTKARKLLEKKK